MGSSIAAVLEELLTEEAHRPHAGNVEAILMIDHEAGNYEVLVVGWDGEARVFGVVVFVRVRNGKIWIEHDWTEHGLAQLLMDRGIPRSEIILGFHPEGKQKSKESIMA